MKSVFQSLRARQTVVDSWFGPGKVVKKTAKHAWIKLTLQDKPWRYDRTHVNHFVRVTK